MCGGSIGPDKNFAANSPQNKIDNDGPFIYKKQYARKDIADGVAHTFFVGEDRDGLNKWTAGMRFATIRTTAAAINTPPGKGAYAWQDNNSATKPVYNGAFGSNHKGGANFAIWRRARCFYH